MLPGSADITDSNGVRIDRKPGQTFSFPSTPHDGLVAKILFEQRIIDTLEESGARRPKEMLSTYPTSQESEALENNNHLSRLGSLEGKSSILAQKADLVYSNR